MNGSAPFLATGVPSMRLCPDCFTPNTHSGRGCRHMLCSNCSLKFCFVCLGPCTCCNSNTRGLATCVHNATSSCTNQRSERQTVSKPLGK